MDWQASLIVLLSLTIINLIRCADNPDIITSLPGLVNKPAFDMYSGYLDGSGTHKLHYWLINSAHSSKDPLIIWISSGPGCSALYSLLTSNGPFIIQSDGLHLAANPHSWNLDANLLYIDAPAGTGFSYTADGLYFANDTTVANDVFLGVQSFFSKYLTFATNSIYLAGDGYAGVYVPLVMQLMDAMPNQVPLQGFAVGNALTSLVQQDNAYPEFAYYHGIIGENLWKTLNKTCCAPGVCNYHNNSNKDCINALNQTNQDINNSGINPFKVNGECQSGELAASLHAGSTVEEGSFHYLAGMLHVFTQHIFTAVERKRIKVTPLRLLKVGMPCVNSTAITAYLNSMYVREALHISASSQKWQLCNAEVDQLYVRQYTDMSSVYTKLIDTFKYHILVYNGDQDSIHNFIGNQRFVAQLHSLEEVQWRPWLYKDSDGQDQTAGFVTEYDNIAFLTIKNAGLWASRDQPIAMGQLIYNFINKRPY